ncbi:MAG: NHL repeat-containing protein [Desulfobulbaceae bacterium]|nr:NHL repeat-containing protein [Desulfobulbaceae bacterium]
MGKLSILTIIMLLNCFFAIPSFAENLLKIKYLQTVYDDERPTQTGLSHPEGVACTDDYFVVADTDNNRLVQYTFADKVVKAGEVDLPINTPIVVQVNSKGVIYGLDGRDRRILKLKADGTEQEYLSPKGNPVSRKMVPRSFKIDKNDKVYILDISDEVVLILDSAGNYLRHIPLPEQSGFFSDLAVDKQGTVFLVDSTEPGVYSAAQDADKFTLLTKGLEEYVNFPTNIALDSRGSIYLVDKHGGSLALIGRDGSFLGHRFGYGWKESQFYYPAQLCISEGGYFFVADRSNSRIQIFAAEEE